MYTKYSKQRFPRIPHSFCAGLFSVYNIPSVHGLAKIVGGPTGQ